MQTRTQQDTHKNANKDANKNANKDANKNANNRIEHEPETNYKEKWDTLQVTHEGTTDVKRSRINTLTHEYELFRMNQNEGE